MKKRVKLFTTIASLCLAVALMAFGVYAAANVTYTVSSTVTYSMSDVLVEVETTVHNVPTYNSKSLTGDSVDALITAAGGEDKLAIVGAAQTFKTVNTADGSKYDDDLTFADDDTAKAAGTHTDEIACNLNTSSLYVITVSVKVYNKNGITVTPTIPTAGEGWAIVTDLATGVAETCDYNTADQKAGEYEFKIAVVLTDATVASIAVDNLDFKFVMEQQD